MKSRDEQLTWAKQRALICVDMGHFSDAVAGLRVDLAENPLTKGVIPSHQAIARIQSGDGRGARPGFASADRVDRGPQVRRSATGRDRIGAAHLDMPFAIAASLAISAMSSSR